MIANVLCGTENMSRKDWLEQRRKGIGASEISSIAGINPYSSPYVVYLDKIGELPDMEQSEAVEWGLTLENVIADKFTKVTGIQHKTCKYILQHPDYLFMLCNLDFVFEENGKTGSLEIKTTSERNKEDWLDETGEVQVPEYYMLQVQHQLCVTGYDYAYIACLIGGQKFVYKKIEREDEIINYLIQIEKNFWEENVLKRIPPAMVGGEKETDVLKQKYPDAIGEINLHPKALEYVTKRREADKVIKEYEKIKDSADNELRLLMGEFEIGYIGDIKIRYPKISKELIDIKKLKQEMPEIYKKYIYKSESRRLYI